MDSELSMVVIDAAPHQLLGSVFENINKPNRNELLNSVLDDLTAEEFKSLFFLLMDHVEVERFINLTKQEKGHLKKKFWEIYQKFKDDCILIEIFGTMKMYKKLRMLGTCHHVYENFQETKFNQINALWKMFYSLCEELSDDDLENLLSSVPANFKNEIVTAEDWFCWALQKEKISKTDLSQLKRVFSNYPRCLKIIQNFEVKQKFYYIRPPTSTTDCGIALIINFHSFDKELNLEDREGSHVDVDSLKRLWNEFGFKTEVFPERLTCIDTFKKLNYFASLDHSNYGAFVCCILSHGKSNSIISSDGKEMPISDLVAAVTNSSTLVSKPKLFFIQACQGTNILKGLKPSDVSGTETIKITVPPIASDVLLAVSSIEGFVSFRSRKDGSWFVQGLYNSMMQYGNERSILDVMTDVNNRVRHHSLGEVMSVQQIVKLTSTLGKILILKKRIS